MHHITARIRAHLQDGVPPEKESKKPDTEKESKTQDTENESKKKGTGSDGKPEDLRMKKATDPTERARAHQKYGQLLQPFQVDHLHNSPPPPTHPPPPHFNSDLCNNLA